jgi:double-strand break repair protein MRE11
LIENFRQVGLLEIVGNEFRVTPIPLTTVRPFVIDEVVLSEHLNPNQIDNTDSDPVIDFLSQKVFFFSLALKIKQHFDKLKK